MPRPSKNRHVVARLRQTLKLGQKELADWADCSRIYIQAVELHQRPLTEKLARQIAEATGVALDWLLQGNYRTAPVTAGGQPLTKETCEKHRAWSKVRRATPEEMERFRALTKDLTVGLAGPTLKKRTPRKDLKGVPFTLALSDRAGRAVPVPKGVAATEVARTLHEDIDQTFERQRLLERAYALLKRSWAVILAGRKPEERWLAMHRLEEAVDKVVKQGKLTVPEELGGTELEHLARYFELQLERPFNRLLKNRVISARAVFRSW